MFFVFPWRGALPVLIGSAACVLAGCNDQPRPRVIQPHIPAETSVPATSPATLPAATTAPESTTPEPAVPESQPASRPVSTYDPSPPYPVQLYVLNPAEDQPGWLKIVELMDDRRQGTCVGLFPEKNRILVDTDNVRRLRLHIGHLPLVERKRIVLRIDRQGIELTRKDREFVLLERRTTGEWTVVAAEDNSN